MNQKDKLEQLLIEHDSNFSLWVMKGELGRRYAVLEKFPNSPLVEAIMELFKEEPTK